LLRIAEIEAEDRRAGFERVDLSSLSADIAAAYAPTIAEQGRTFAIDVPPRLRHRQRPTISADP
jgi:hypothetical protein